MQTYQFNTGRTYNGKQILVITHRDIGFDEDLLDMVEVAFYDPSRNVKGAVRLMVFCFTTQHEVGRTVLDLYDAGAYKTV